VSSRLVRAPSGKPTFVEVTAPLPELERGARFLVLGNELRRPAGIGWTGQTDARPPTPDEQVEALRRVGQVERVANAWTDEHREEAHRLQAEGLSWSQIAEQVCGARRYKSTVQTWLRTPVAGNGDGPVAH
jgi:hypothetical protein